MHSCSQGLGAVLTGGGCTCWAAYGGASSLTETEAPVDGHRWNLPWPHVHLRMMQSPTCISSPSTASGTVLVGRQRFTAPQRCERATPGRASSDRGSARAGSGTASHSWSALLQRRRSSTDPQFQLDNNAATKPAAWRGTGACRSLTTKGYDHKTPIRTSFDRSCMPIRDLSTDQVSDPKHHHTSQAAAPTGAAHVPR